MKVSPRSDHLNGHTTSFPPGSKLNLVYSCFPLFAPGLTTSSMPNILGKFVLLQSIHLGTTYRPWNCEHFKIAKCERVCIAGGQIVPRNHINPIKLSVFKIIVFHSWKFKPGCFKLWTSFIVDLLFTDLDIAFCYNGGYLTGHNQCLTLRYAAVWKR